MSDFFENLWTTLQTKFSYLFTGVSAAINIVLSELPDAEVDMIHGAINVGLAAIKAGKTFEQAWTEALNYAQQQEVQIFSTVGEHFIKAVLASAHPDIK